MLKIIFLILGNSFSYQFLANWTKLLQICLDYHQISWEAIFLPKLDLKKFKEEVFKKDFAYLMSIDSQTVFQAESFIKLLETMEKNPKIKALTGKSLKKNSSLPLFFTLIRKNCLKKIKKDFKLSVQINPQIILGYEKITIWH